MPYPAAHRAAVKKTIVDAQGIASLCIGGMVVARALVDPALASELRDACMSVALNLGGWSTPPKSKHFKSKAAAAH
jgi:hypothetical protein